MFLVLQSLVFFVISHAEYSQSRLQGVNPLGKHYKFGHERNMYCFPIELGSHLSGVSHIAAVHEPEPRRHGGGERNAVVNEGKRCRTCDILPLRPRRTPCTAQHSSQLPPAHLACL
ncbi:uncharacterized protein LOC124359188 [Homalodisca vitripennis]|uniref:uncharacterized protein LOC124359188 n=1 Tax=Homalodisca vitripennis TaxID=197043 RepID=UPI001EECB432|nr:uncharacterized protein LOC124359188 [Homalodisca vitripennis]